MMRGDTHSEMNNNTLTDGTWIRAGTTKDVSAIVGVHLRSFEGFFLSFLEPAFLGELYAAILANFSSIDFVDGQH